jgi:hypothetical protein
MEEAENLISTLVDHVDAQLVLALSCFLGLGPAEVSGLQWGDVDADWIHIRRNKPSHGEVGPPKNQERAAAVSIVDQVRAPLELWRGKCEATGDGDWVIVDLPNMINRVIKPHVIGEKVCDRCEKTPKASTVKWKGLYAGRRGACTAVIEATGGNYAVAQALLRHKTMDTTLRVYKKQITPQGLLAGMQTFQKSLGKQGQCNRDLSIVTTQTERVIPGASFQWPWTFWKDRNVAGQSARSRDSPHLKFACKDLAATCSDYGTTTKRLLLLSVPADVVTVTYPVVAPVGTTAVK